jgi:ZIP family zinc transporter
MPAWFVEAHPALQALLACLFTWAVTALGAGLVFFFRDVNRVVLDSMMGFAAGGDDCREFLVAPGSRD